MMPGLDRPWLALVGLLLALAAPALVLRGFARRQRRLARYGTPEALARLAPPDAARRPTRRAVVLGVAALAMGVALAGPRWGAATEVLESDGIDIAIAVDVSLSMLAEDERPSRLERVKQELRRLRASSPGDRMALIAFAGRSYILSPLTADDGALELFLDNLDPSIVGQGGSSIAAPLRQGRDLLLASRGDADRALVLMSDGEAFDDREEALRQAGELKQAGIHLVTVGFGSAGGATIPLPGSGGADLKRDENGEVVITRTDERLLEALAVAAGGEFVPPDATDKGNRIRRALATLEATARAEHLRASRPLRYQWFVALALVLLLLDALASDGARWPSWLRLRRAGMVLALLGAGAADAAAQGPSFADALARQRAGDALGAVRAYRALIADGDRRAVLLYNLGTALLAADSIDAAIETLERATFTADPDLRRNARYNLGLAYLQRGRRLNGEAQGSALTAAKRAFRTVLLERPGDPDAQWNYELAMREPTGGGGGGGGGRPPQGPPPPEPQPQRQMSRQQAEALLDASAREERDTQARRRRGDQRAPVTGPDW